MSEAIETAGKAGKLLAVVVAASLALAVFVVPAMSAAAGAGTWVDEELLAVPPLRDEIAGPALRSRVIADDGSLIGILTGPENRIAVSLDRVPQHVIDALLATEDADFYEHNGVDHGAVLRALITNVQTGDVEQGGSTLTQQYIKNAVLSNERSLVRKIKEALYAVQIEDRLTKDEILERYLNLAYYGNGVYGVGTAAEFYWGVSVEELTIAQGAVLAGMVRAPEKNDPVDAPGQAMARRDVVLHQMAFNGFITDEQRDAALATDLALNLRPLPPPSDPFFLEYVKETLLDDPRLGETRGDRVNAVFGGGLTIETTIDPEMQQQAHDAVAAYLTDPSVDPLGALVSLENGTARVKAMSVGPKAFGVCAEEPCTTTKVNPVVPGAGGSGRQAGSSFKPFVLAAALENGLRTSWSHSGDEGNVIPGCGKIGEPWEPSNYSRGRIGTLDMVEAVKDSNNVFHAGLIAEVGPAKVAETARRMGIDNSEVPAVCAIALGAADVYPIDMAEAYLTLANGGVACEASAIDRVLDADGNVLLENTPQCIQAISTETAHQVTAMLEGVVQRGTGRGAQIGRPVAGKTGTTNDYRDAWFVGYTPQLVTAAWIGFEQPAPMRDVLGRRVISGGSIPAQMWASYMRPAMARFEVTPFPRVRLDRYVPPPPPPPPAPTAEPQPDPPSEEPKPEKKKDKEEGGDGGDSAPAPPPADG